MTLPYKRLFIWVEGLDDIRFFDQIIKPILAEKYSWVEVRAYADRTSKYIENFIKSIKAMPADYIFVADLNASPCVTDKKQRLKKTFGNIDEDQIVVIIQEIESWYLAGLDETGGTELLLPNVDNTNSLTKEDFNRLVPRKFDSRIDFLSEILKRFSINEAIQKNKSFSYFMEKYRYK